MWGIIKKHNFKIMNKRPNVSIKILLRHKDKVLMLRHKNGAHDFPGGRME